ncbi:MAG: 30S ribosomal protein S10 [Acidobacteriota bacterium]
MQKIKIKLMAFDYRVLDKSAGEIAVKARRTGAKVSGPIPLPTKIERFCVLRSPHVDKKSREHFEIRTHKRLIYINEYNEKTIDELRNLELPAGIHVDVKSE